MAEESVHVNGLGAVLRNYNDGDNSVFLHSNETTGEEVDKKYINTDGNSAGGRKIGELGGNININRFFSNLMVSDRIAAKGLGMISWGNMVKQDAPWDLKDDYKGKNPTIFGVAWKFDLDAKKADPNAANTSFTYGAYKFSSAADVGNYHAGYTGTYAGVDYDAQWKGAGIAEILKNKKYLQLINPSTFASPPYGDNPIDYKWNTQGMTDAAKQQGKILPANWADYKKMFNED
ncbi:polymorphic toxin type 44 domain-containing protein [Flavitalea flava]